MSQVAVLISSAHQLCFGKVTAPLGRTQKQVRGKQLYLAGRAAPAAAPPGLAVGSLGSVMGSPLGVGRLG